MRSASQLTRSPGEWSEYQQAERRRILRELRSELELARDRREPWLAWLEARRDGIHLHELRRESGESIACPVAGCDAVRSSRPAPSSSDAPRRPAELERLTLC